LKDLGSGEEGLLHIFNGEEGWLIRVFLGKGRVEGEKLPPPDSMQGERRGGREKERQEPGGKPPISVFVVTTTGK